MQRRDANSEHWKAKFIDDLRYLFAERIRRKLRNDNIGINIVYDQYAYGQLTYAIISEGLDLCSDLKLQKQPKKQNLISNRELGEFCDQFSKDNTISYPQPRDKENKERRYKSSYKK